MFKRLNTPVFARHWSESEQHMRSLEEAFRQLGWEAGTSPCPIVGPILLQGRWRAGDLVAIPAADCLRT